MRGMQAHLPSPLLWTLLLLLPKTMKATSYATSFTTCSSGEGHAC